MGVVIYSDQSTKYCERVSIDHFLPLLDPMDMVTSFYSTSQGCQVSTVMDSNTHTLNWPNLSNTAMRALLSHTGSTRVEVLEALPVLDEHNHKYVRPTNAVGVSPQTTDVYCPIPAC